MPEEQIVKELRSQAVVSVYKFMKKVDDPMVGNYRIDDDHNIKCHETSIFRLHGLIF